jgi:hypothetical protein
MPVRCADGGAGLGARSERIFHLLEGSLGMAG